MSGTPARKRINATEQRVIARSISGSLQQVVGSLAWGPRFGKNTDDTFVAEADGPVLDAVDFTGVLAPQATIDLVSLDLDGALDALGVIDLVSIDLLGSLAAQAGFDLFSVDFEGGTATDATIDLFTVDPTGNLLPQGTVDLDSLDLDGGVAASARHETDVEVTDWLATGDVWLDEENPDTNNGSVIFNEARAQSTLANDRKHAYIKWDVGGTFEFNGTTGLVTDVEFVIYVSSDANLVENPAELFYEVQFHNTDPFDESTATWNNTEPPPGAIEESGSISIDNTATRDGGFAGRNLYRVEINLAFNGDFELGVEGLNSRRWWWLRLLGDTRLGQDNVEFEIVSADVSQQLDDSGRDMRPTLNFTYEGLR